MRITQRSLRTATKGEHSQPSAVSQKPLLVEMASAPGRETTCRERVFNPFRVGIPGLVSQGALLRRDPGL